MVAAGFAVAVAYWPGFNGGATWPRWAVLALCICPLVAMGPVRVTLAHGAGALFVILAALSLLWSAAWYDSVAALLCLLILAGVFMIGSKLSDLRAVYLGAALGIGASSILISVDVLGGSAALLTAGQWAGGLFVNPLFMAEAAALVAVACFASPDIRWAALLTVPAIVGPVLAQTARGPMLTLAACAVVALYRRRPVIAAGIGAAGVAAVAVAMWLRPGSVVDRVNIWGATITGINPFGHGFGSFLGAFPEYGAGWLAGLTRQEHAHNLLLEIAFELGPVGVAVAAVFFLVLLRGALTAERVVLVGFLVEGLFAFPDRLPVTASLAMLCAGHAARDLPHWRDALGLGRDVLRARDERGRSARGN